MGISNNNGRAQTLPGTKSRSRIPAPEAGVKGSRVVLPGVRWWINKKQGHATVLAQCAKFLSVILHC